MARYSVDKYFGHFWQSWDVNANSKEEAWEIAERKGTRVFMSVYAHPIDLNSKGYVKNMDEYEEANPRMTEEQYYAYMREAIEKGMICKPEEYEKATGLPFVDVWR